MAEATGSSPAVEAAGSPSAAAGKGLDKRSEGKASEEISIILSKLAWWNRPLDEPMHGRLRFFFAGAGSIVWVGAQMTDPFALAAIETFSGGVLPAPILAILICLVSGGWFGLLIAYQRRRCSPSRFFIEGLLFPAFTGVLISESPIRAVLGG